MSITSLIVGKLVSQSVQRNGARGKLFTTARLAAGTEDESVLASVIAFGSTGAQLAALAQVDTVALVGRTRPKAWMKDGEPKAGFDVVADQLLTAYRFKRKRAALAGDGQGAPPQPTANPAPSGDHGGHRSGDDEWLRASIDARRDHRTA